MSLIGPMIHALARSQSTAACSTDGQIQKLEVPPFFSVTLDPFCSVAHAPRGLLQLLTPSQSCHFEKNPAAYSYSPSSGADPGGCKSKRRQKNSITASFRCSDLRCRFDGYLHDRRSANFVSQGLLAAAGDFADIFPVQQLTT